MEAHDKDISAFCGSQKEGDFVTPPRETFTHRIWHALDDAAREAVREEQAARTVEQLAAAVECDNMNKMHATLGSMARQGRAIRHRSGIHRAPVVPVVWTVGTEPPFSRPGRRKSTVTLPIATVRAALAGDAAARAEIAAAIGGEA